MSRFSATHANHNAALSIEFPNDIGNVMATISICEFTEQNNIGILYESSTLNISNSYFNKIYNKDQGRVSCIHCLLDSISKRYYYLNNVTFDSYNTEDFGVMNIPNVEILIENCKVFNCKSSDSDNHKDAHTIILTGNNIDFPSSSVILKCEFNSNIAGN